MTDGSILSSLNSQFQKAARHRLRLDPPDVLSKKYRIENDLFYFGSEVLKNDRLGTIHEEFSERLKLPWRRILALWPRDHLKSTYITGYLVAQLLLKDPDERVLISSYNMSLAQTFLNTIKVELLHPDINALYCDLTC